MNEKSSLAAEAFAFLHLQVPSLNTLPLTAVQMQAVMTLGDSGVKMN